MSSNSCRKKGLWFSPDNGFCISLDKGLCVGDGVTSFAAIIDVIIPGGLNPRFNNGGSAPAPSRGLVGFLEVRVISSNEFVNDS